MEPGARDRRHRWLALDGARGGAALAVLIFHLHNFGPDPVAAGYRAVDFFFVLSGFVIAHAYGTRLQTGMSFVAFARARLTRLYPLYLAGTALGLITVLAVRPGLTAGPVGIAVTTLSALAMVPAKLAGVRYLFPLDNPAWSLLYELVANAVFALALGWLKPVRLLQLVVTFLGGLVLVALIHHSLSVGPKWDRIAIPGALVRVGFSFFAGVLIERYRPGWSIRSDLAALGVALAPLGLCLVLPYIGGADLAIDAVLFPAIVWLGAGVQPRSRVGATGSAEAGRLSYAAYTLHFPILLLMQAGLAGRLAPAAAMALTGAAVIVASGLATHLYDEPVRRWFTRRTAREAP